MSKKEKNQAEKENNIIFMKEEIAGTTYEVSAHFSTISVENVQDKLRRIILSNGDK